MVFRAAGGDLPEVVGLPIRASCINREAGNAWLTNRAEETAVVSMDKLTATA